jgi:hypothetical protein
MMSTRRAADAVAVGEAVGVAVGDAVGVAVGVAVGDAVGVAVGVGSTIVGVRISESFTSASL